MISCVQRYHLAGIRMKAGNSLGPFFPCGKAMLRIARMAIDKQALVSNPAVGRQQQVQAGLPKDQKTARDIALQPRHIIPLDESDHDVLKRF